MARKRTLRPEEERLWQAVARTAAALRPQPPDRPRAAIADLPARLAPAPDPAPPPPAFPGFRIGERPPAPLPPSAGPAAPPLRMDARAFGRMARGRLVPEARLDLHGMTLAEAHPELVRFVLGAQARGLRLVLVITGKGGPGGDGPADRPRGVLRRQVPHWLRLPPLAAAVLQVAEAHPRHGGSGALYLYLRRGGG